MKFIQTQATDWRAMVYRTDRELIRSCQGRVGLVWDRSIGRVVFVDKPERVGASVNWLTGK